MYLFMEATVFKGIVKQLSFEAYRNVLDYCDFFLQQYHIEKKWKLAKHLLLIRRCRD